VDFELSDEQRMLRDATRRLLEARSPLTAVRAAHDSEPGFDRGLWLEGSALGWPGMAVPEELGGSGQGIVELAVVAQEHGRLVQPGPFLPTATVTLALVAAGADRPEVRERTADVLGGAADGTSILSWAFAEPGRGWLPEATATQATRAAGGLVVTGVKTSVQDADVADVLLVTARCDGELVQLLVDRSAPGVSCTRLRGLDLGRHLCEVRLDGVRAPESAVVATGTAAVERDLAAGAVLLCAESVGVGARLLEMTVDYAKMRVQFGRPIGSFQATKHKCATMRSQLQGAQVATYYAAMALAAGTDDADTAASVATSFTSEAVSRIAGEALQIHGGIGFTWEHDLHLYLRRAKSNEVLYGDASLHRELLCRNLEREIPVSAGTGH
jgi:alkylation response protein AidB-like acyl-CoA dehydrogenase